MSNSAEDYSSLDISEILMFLFHPRTENGYGSSGVKEILIPVDEQCHIGARYYPAEANGPTILFFHGNGEIVADYDDLAPFFVQSGISFLPVDYRGYGRSTGSPTVTSMMKDCHEIYRYTRNFLKEKNTSGPLVIMGRSLGSASALELASHYGEEIDGLIIESGFAHILPLLQLLGINPGALGITKDPIANLEKISSYSGPTLVIHAEFDHIIPFSDGQELFSSSQDPEKEFLKIKGANHNNIFAYGFEEYLSAVRKMISERCR